MDSRVLLWGAVRVRVAFRSLGRVHQGVSVAFDEAESGRTLLRFDAYDELAHYHYDPAGRNERFWLDPSFGLHAQAWMLSLIRDRLPSMLAHGGLSGAVGAPGPEFLAALQTRIEAVDRAHRQTLIHEPGDHLIPAGRLVVGLRYDREGEGVSVRVLRSGEADLEEMVGFDCHLAEPHYHYGPRRKNAVIPIDPAACAHPLAWALSMMSGYALPRLLERAGYPDVLGSQDEVEAVARVVQDTVAPLAMTLERSGRASVLRTTP